jgi:hypothetical protein
VGAAPPGKDAYMAAGDPCPEGKYGCQNCGGGPTTAGNGNCHVCGGSGKSPEDPGTPCTVCFGNKTCRNCGGSGCL